MAITIFDANILIFDAKLLKFDAISAISKDSELSFDYQWPASSRPPTPCHCKTPSCRGFLEVGLETFSNSKKGKDKDKDKEKERERKAEKKIEKRRIKEREKEKNKERWDSEENYAGNSREFRSFGRKKGLWKSRSDLTFIIDKIIVKKMTTENSEKIENDNNMTIDENKDENNENKNDNKDEIESEFDTKNEGECEGEGEGDGEESG